MGRPKISVVTPTLNAEKYIEELIRSLETQTYQDYEHIVVDGRSSDGTVAILKRHENRSNFRWVSEPDSGMYEALNKGFSMAKGEIQAFLPADDLYLPWTFGLVAQRFDGNRNADIVYGDTLISRMDGRYAMVYFNPNPSILSKLLLTYTPATTPFFWRRKIFEELGGFDPRFKIAGDYDFVARASSNYVFSKIDEVLTLWRFRPFSKTRDRQTLFRESVQVSAKLGGLSSSRGLPLMYYRMTGYFLGSSYPAFWRLFAHLLRRDMGDGWARLIDSNAVSSKRLLRDLLMPLLPQYLLAQEFRSKFFPGYVDVAKSTRRMER